MSRLLLFVLLCHSLVAYPETSVSFDGWARATAPGATTGAIYGKLQNGGSEAVSLSSVRFEKAGHVMVHRTVESDGMMRMMHAEVTLEPGASVVLEPGGLHIMLMGLKAPLIPGCIYKVELEWDESASTSHDFVTGSFGQSTKPERPGQSCQ